ncbi:MAG TPA: aldehyde dehydrogenase family protein [Candidatus Binatia bacterium]|jgi:betaine-aldehyde dehydrogenase|nr:aldehyde dehydrogenase family protein [Candidatus Binatia bacterium]
MKIPNQLFINGRFQGASSGKVFSLVNPANEELLGDVAAGDERDVETAVAGAERAYEDVWRDMAPGKRTETLFRLAALMRQHAEELAQLEMLNIGKPISDARDEVGLGARIFEYYAGAVTKFYGQTIPVARGGFDFTVPQPLGVVAAIVPWNFPFPITCWKAAPALATGNCVVVKPASLSPLTALRLGELGADAGLPDGVLQIVPGPGGQAGEALARHPLVRKISFTGSTAVGARLMEIAARSLKPVALELGGKSPNIVFADADIEQAAAASPMSVFANTGQDCCARSRVFVERAVFEQFVERFAEATARLVAGDPSRAETQLGPLVSAHQRRVVREYLETAKIPRHKVIVAGGELPAKGFFLQPAIVLGCEPDERIWREEIFGPVVCIRPFDREEEMLKEANASPYGLSGSLWTNDLRRALRVAGKVESGVLSVNSHSSVHVETPFGGFKQSGFGRDHGMKAMETFTELKNVYIPA